MKCVLKNLIIQDHLQTFKFAHVYPVLFWLRTRVWLGTKISGFMTVFANNMCLGKQTFINLIVSPIDAGSENCTQGAPPVKGR